MNILLMQKVRTWRLKMPVKGKNNFDMQRQRQSRGKMGIPGQRYDDSSFNAVNHISKVRLKKSHIKQNTSQVNKNA